MTENQTFDDRKGSCSETPLVALYRSWARLLDYSTGRQFLIDRKAWEFRLWGVRVLWWSESDDSLSARAIARYDELQDQRHLMRRCDCPRGDEL